MFIDLCRCGINFPQLKESSHTINVSFYDSIFDFGIEVDIIEFVHSFPSLEVCSNALATKGCDCVACSCPGLCKCNSFLLCDICLKCCDHWFLVLRESECSFVKFFYFFVLAECIIAGFHECTIAVCSEMERGNISINHIFLLC